jgi:hypothetical protein
MYLLSLEINYVYNMTSNDSTKETNSKTISDEDYEEEEEEQPTLPAKTSSDGSTKTSGAADDKKKVIVVTPSSTKTEYKTKSTQQQTSEEGQKQQQQQQQSSIPAKAKEVGKSLTEKVKSVGKKTIAKTEEKTKQLKDKSTQTAGIGPEKDAHDIQALDSTRLQKITTIFEETMNEINTEPDREGQKKQLTGYKKLLEEQINVIDSCLNMVRRLKKDG